MSVHFSSTTTPPLHVESNNIGDASPADSSSKSSTFLGFFAGLSIKATFNSLIGREAHKAASKEAVSEEAFATPSLNSHSTDAPPGTSLKERLKSFLFGTPKSETSEATAPKGTSLLSWFSGKMFSTTPRTIRYGKSDNEKGIKIPDRGTFKFSAEQNPQEIGVINKSLNIEDYKRVNDLITFAQDAKRGFDVLFKGEKETISSVGMAGSTPGEQAAKIRKSRQVIKATALSFSHTLRHESKLTSIEQLHNLEHDLILLNPQSLLAAPNILFGSEHAPESGFFPVGGVIASFTYAKTADREITITAKGTLSSSPSSSTLMGRLKGQLVAQSSDNHYTTGNFDMVLKAQVGDDGHITSLKCHSATVGYQVHDNKPEVTA